MKDKLGGKEKMKDEIYIKVFDKKDKPYWKKSDREDVIELK